MTRSITIRINGGLGNQLHGYAFGRAVASNCKAVLKLDVESGYWNDPYNRVNLLGQFPSIKVCNNPFPLKSRLAPIFFKCILKLRAYYSRLLPVPLKSVVVENRPPRYQRDIHRARYFGDTYFIGYWASYLYYQDIENDLRQELKPPVPVDSSAIEMLKKINSVKSCFIHWRSYNEEKGVGRSSLRAYYKNAINLVSAKYSDVVFFVFSDDPAAARNEIEFPGRKLIYVDLPSAKGNLQSLADFYLMYACNHAIIGDSTFSWWAAWLSEQNGKIVVAPRGLSPLGEDWVPPHWIPLDMNRSE